MIMKDTRDTMNPDRDINMSATFAYQMKSSQDFTNNQRFISSFGGSSSG